MEPDSGISFSAAFEIPSCYGSSLITAKYWDLALVDTQYTGLRIEFHFVFF